MSDKEKQQVLIDGLYRWVGEIEQKLRAIAEPLTGLANPTADVVRECVEALLARVPYEKK